MIFLFIIIIVVTYLAGSVNFAVILLKLLGKDDPRTQFSGNAGATNVYRLAGMFWASLVLFMDIGRAFVCGYIALVYLDSLFLPWVGLALIIGNRFPCWHGFQGGKGVAGYLGFTAVLSPYAALFSCLAWVLAFGIIRIPFVASFFMITVLAAGTIINYIAQPVAVAGVITTASLIFYNHKTNFLSLMREKKGEG